MILQINRIRNIMSIVLFFAALIVTFTFSFLSVDMNDNPYQIKLGNYYNETGTFYSGFTYLTHFLYAKLALFIGDQFVYFRLFNSFVVFATIFLPFLFFYKKFDNKNIIQLFSILILLFVPFVRLSIGWDAISDFFIMLSFLLFLEIVYFNNKNIFLKFVVLLVFVIAISIKITNIILPFFYLFFFLFIRKFKINVIVFRNIFLFGILFILFYLSFLSFFFPNIQTYFNFFAKTTGNLNESYSLFGLLNRIFTHLKFSIKPLILALIFIYGFIYYKGKYHTVIRTFIILILMGAFYHFILIERNFYIYNLVIEFFTIVIICYLLLISKLNYQSKIVFIMILCIGFLPTLGSNTGLAKMNTFVYIPIVYLFVMHANTIKYFKYLFVLFFVYAIALKAIYFVDMEPFYEAKKINKGKIFPMISSNKNHKMFSELDQKIKNIDKNNVYFYGMNSHIFDYLYDKNTPIFLTFDRNLNNENEFYLFEEVLKNTSTNSVLIYPKDYYVSSIQAFKKCFFYKKLNRFNPIIQEDEYFIYFIVNKSNINVKI